MRRWVCHRVTEQTRSRTASIGWAYSDDTAFDGHPINPYRSIITWNGRDGDIRLWRLMTMMMMSWNRVWNEIWWRHMTWNDNLRGLSKFSVDVNGNDWTNWKYRAICNRKRTKERKKIFFKTFLWFLVNFMYSNFGWIASY